MILTLVVASLLPHPDLALDATGPQTPTERQLDTATRRQVVRLQSTVAEQRRQGRYDEAIEPARELLGLCTGELGERHWMTRDARRQLRSLERLSRLPVEQRKALLDADRRMIEGLGLEQQGRAREAEQRYRSALLVRLRLLGDSFPDSLISRGRLASSLRAQFRLTEAERAYRDLLAASRVHLGELHPRTASTYADLALTLDYQQRHSESEPLLRRSHEINTHILENGHPAGAASVERLAANLGAQGKLADEETRRRRALELAETVTGKDSLATAGACVALASCLQTQGRHADARPFFDRGCRIHEVKLETGDPVALRGLARRATNLDRLGRHDEAGEILTKVLEDLDGSGSEARPLAAAVRGWLGANLERRGRTLDAEARFREEIDILVSLSGDRSRQTALAVSNLSRNLELQGALDDGATLTASLLRRMTPVSRLPAHRFAFHARRADNLRARGEHRAARALWDRVIPGYRDIDGDAHPIVRRASLSLIETLHHLGEVDAAHQLCRQTYDHALRSFGKESPDTIPVVEALAINASGRGDHAEATGLRERVVKLTAARFSTQHARTAVARVRLGSTLLDAGHPERATASLEAALAMFAKLEITVHPAIVDLRTELAHLRLAASDFPGAMLHLGEAAIAFDAVRELVWHPRWWRIDLERMRSPRPFLAILLARAGEFAEAWRTLETHFVRGSLDIRSRSWLRSRQTLEAAWETALLDDLQSRREALRTAEAAGSVESVEALRARITEIETLHETLRGRRDRDVAVMLDDDPASLERISGSLTRGEALISWVDIAPRSGLGAAPALHWVFVLTHDDGPTALRLANVDASLTRRLQTALRSKVGRGVSQTTVESLDGLAEAVAGQRLGPLAPALGKVDRLIVLPSSNIDGIPVDLLDSRYRVELAISGSMLASTRESRGRRRAKRAGPQMLIVDGLSAGRSRGPEITAKPPTHGALVFLVTKDSNADRAGVRVGDVILSYDSRRVGTSDELNRRIRATGDLGGSSKSARVKLRLWRAGETLDVEVLPGRLGVRTYRESPDSVLRTEREVEELIALGAAVDPADSPERSAEIDAIRAIASKGAPADAVKVLANGDATRRAIDALNGSGGLLRFRRGHMAVPVTLDDEAPLRSRLALAVPAAPGSRAAKVLAGKRDTGGAILALDILRHWRLDMDVVGFSDVLSGARGFDGARGLARACIGAGARSIVVNAWPVADAPRRVFWTSFWKRVISDRSSAAYALEKAKSDTRAAGFEDPRHWAGFTLVGDGA